MCQGLFVLVEAWSRVWVKLVECLWLRVVAGGKVTIPLLVCEVLKIEAGDYVRLNINQVIKKKQKEEKAGRVI